MINFEELLIKRRSIRKFTEENVSSEMLIKIIKDASCAPSSGLHELSITEDQVIVAPIAVGYPEEIPGMPKRKEPEIRQID